MDTAEAKASAASKAPSDGGSTSPHQRGARPGSVPDPGGDTADDEAVLEEQRNRAAEQARIAENTRLK